MRCRFIKWFIQYSISRRMDLFRHFFAFLTLYACIASVNYSMKNTSFGPKSKYFVLTIVSEVRYFWP